MKWKTKYIYISKYEFASSNQHGNRFKNTGNMQLEVAEMRCKVNDANDVQKLILLGNTLNVPVRYCFEEHEAYIEVVSKEALMRCI